MKIIDYSGNHFYQDHLCPAPRVLQKIRDDANKTTTKDTTAAATMSNKFSRPSQKGTVQEPTQIVLRVVDIYIYIYINRYLSLIIMIMIMIMKLTFILNSSSSSSSYYYYYYYDYYYPLPSPGVLSGSGLLWPREFRDSAPGGMQASRALPGGVFGARRFRGFQGLESCQGFQGFRYIYIYIYIYSFKKGFQDLRGLQRQRCSSEGRILASPA